MTKILEIPRKNEFSVEDHNKWKLSSVDFSPFIYQDEFAENINKIFNGIKSLTNKDLLETLEKAKSFACSTIILDSKGNLQRVFFASPKDLENFLINYKE